MTRPYPPDMLPGGNTIWPWDTLMSKIHNFLHTIIIFFQHLFDNFNHCFKDNEIWNFLKFKLSQLLQSLHVFVSYMVDKFNYWFPPETRSGITFQLLKWAGLVLLVYLLYKCCCCCGRGLKHVYRRCCCCSRGRRMKAPGRNGEMMRRNDFEADPRGYFRNLRAHPPPISDFEANPRDYFRNLRAHPPPIILR